MKPKQLKRCGTRLTAGTKSTQTEILEPETTKNVIKKRLALLCHAILCRFQDEVNSNEQQHEHVKKVGSISKIFFLNIVIKTVRY